MKALYRLWAIFVICTLTQCEPREESQEEKQKSVEAYLSQPLQFSTPIRIAKTNNYCFTTFRGENYSSEESYLSMKARKQVNINNVVFLSKEWKPMRTLFNHQAYIQTLDLPDDSTKRNFIAYLAAIEDTNRDLIVDDKDDTDLFISDLDGANLTRVSPKVQVISYQYHQEGKEILLRFAERSTEKKPKKEKLGVFFVESKYFQYLQPVDSVLNEIKKMNKVHIKE